MRAIASSDITIAEATSPADANNVRSLFVEYQQWLGADLCLQNCSDELQTLPGACAPPGGRMLLARHSDSMFAAGVGMRPLAPETCDVKHLHVLPAWRGLGLGRRLAKTIVETGSASGYARTPLDPFPYLDPAMTLYRSMGFFKIKSYNDNPLDEVSHMEKVLDQEGAVTAAHETALRMCAGPTA